MVGSIRIWTVSVGTVAGQVPHPWKLTLAAASQFDSMRERMFVRCEFVKPVKQTGMAPSGHATAVLPNQSGCGGASITAPASELSSKLQAPTAARVSAIADTILGFIIS